MNKRASIQKIKRDLGVLFSISKDKLGRKSSELENRFCKLFLLS